MSLDLANVPTLTKAYLNQAAPVQNTWYTVCTLKSVSILQVNINIATASETCDIEITIDGVVYTLTGFAMTFANQYWMYLGADCQSQVLDLTHQAAGIQVAFNYSSAIPCRQFKMRIRKTTAAGAGNLQALVMYNQY